MSISLPFRLRWSISWIFLSKVNLWPSLSPLSFWQPSIYYNIFAECLVPIISKVCRSLLASKHVYPVVLPLDPGRTRRSRKQQSRLQYSSEREVFARDSSTSTAARKRRLRAPVSLCIADGAQASRSNSIHKLQGVHNCAFIPLCLIHVSQIDLRGHEFSLLGNSAYRTRRRNPQ